MTAVTPLNSANKSRVTGNLQAGVANRVLSLQAQGDIRGWILGPKNWRILIKFLILSLNYT